nr:TATA box-binding protein-associated factor RNA polymerase I subunit D isoform X2 [Paramormyrops kingsleyae]
MGSDTELTYEADSPETRLRLQLPGLSGRSADALLAPRAAVLPNSDSGDSLFQTQPVTRPLRTERRKRPQRLQLPSTASESDTDSEGDNCPKRSRKSLLKFQRYKPNQETQKKYDRNGPVFPFLAKKNNKSEHLPRRKVLLFEHGAIGGFFTYMKKVKDKSEKGLPSRFLSLRRRFLDEDGELLPLSNPEQAEGSQASDDIKIVAQKDFILKYHGRLRGNNIWTGKFSSDAGQDSMKDRRKASSNLKKSIHAPKVQTRSRARRSLSTRNTDVEDDGSDNCGISTEQEYESDTTDTSSLSSDTSPQEEDEECTVTDVLDSQGAVKRRKPTRTQRSTHTVKKRTSSAAVIRRSTRSTPLDAETAGSSEEMPHSELQQSPDVIQLEKQMTDRTGSQCFFLPIENCEAGISNTGSPTKICEQGSLEGVTEDAIPHLGSQELWELGEISIKRTERGKESLQEQTLDASKEKVLEQTEKESVEQAHLPEHRMSLSLTKEGIRKDVVAEDEAPLISHDDVHEISTTAVNVQDEQDYAEHVPSQNTLEKPTDKMSQKIFEGSSGCKYELNKAIRKKQQISQEVILNLENEESEELFDSNYGQRLLHGEEGSVEEERTQDVYAQSTTDSQHRKPSVETACGKGEEEFFMWKSSKSERRRLETSIKDLNVEYTYTTENVSPHKKKSKKHMKVVDLQNDLNEEGRDCAPVAKSQSHSSSSSYNQTKRKQVISETSVDQISDIGSYPPEPKDNTDFDVACHDLEKRRRKKRKRGEKEEQSHSSSSSYNQTKRKQVISETSVDQISDIGSYPPEPKDNTDFDVACHDLEKRRRKKRKRGEKEEQSHSSSSSYNQTKRKQVISETSVDQISDIGSYPLEPKDNTDFDVACHDLEKRRRKKRKRGEKEEQFSISGSRECLSALNSPTHKCSDRERYTEPVEMSPLSSSDDVVKKKKKEKRWKPGSAEESDELGGSFIASYSGHFLGGNNGVRWNIAEDRSMEFESQGERSMADPEHHNSEHQPSKKKHKKGDSDNSGSKKTTRQISSSKVTPVTGLRLSPGLQSETSRDTKAGKSHKTKEKLVSNYDPAVSKLAGMDTDRDCHGRTTDIQEVSSGVNAIQERSKVSQCKSRGHSLCDKKGHGTLPMVKQSPYKQRLFAIRRFQHLQQTGSYIYQTLIWNYLHSKKGNRDHGFCQASPDKRQSKVPKRSMHSSVCMNMLKENFCIFQYTLH